MKSPANLGVAVRGVLVATLVLAASGLVAPKIHAQATADFFVTTDVPQTEESLQFIRWFLLGFFENGPLRMHGPYKETAVTHNLSWGAPRMHTQLQPVAASEIIGRRMPAYSFPPLVFTSALPTERREGAHYVIVPSDLRGEDLLVAACEAGRDFLGYGECLRGGGGSRSDHRYEFEVSPDRRGDYRFRHGDNPIEPTDTVRLRYELNFTAPQLGDPQIESFLDDEPVGALSRVPLAITIPEALARGIDEGGLLLSIRDRSDVLPVERDPSGGTQHTLSTDGLAAGRRQLVVEIKDARFGRVLIREERTATVYTRERVRTVTGECIPDGADPCSTRPIWMGSAEYVTTIPSSFRSLVVEIEDRRLFLLVVVLLSMLLAFVVQRRRRKTQRIGAVAVASAEASYRGNRSVRVILIEGDVILSEIAPELGEARGMVRNGILSSGGELALSDGADTWRSWRATLDCDELGVWDNGCRYVALDAAGAKRLMDGAQPSVEPPSAPPDALLPLVRGKSFVPTRWLAVVGGPLAGLGAAVVSHAVFSVAGLTHYTVGFVVAGAIVAALLARRSTPLARLT